ncbi:DUF4190 domain-containing protein [Aeromicrobium sp.]|uniref:DUF4190 domain-containing protein n=1 Tax=Aeromicrobium sp. TaxID=1871063 RepID=UPI003D6A34F8
MSSDGPEYPEYPGQEPEHQPDQGPSREPGAQPPPPPGGPPPPPPAPPGQPWQPSASAYGQPGAPGSVPTNQKAIWALVLGIVGLVCCGIGIVTAIPALIVGILARKEIGASGGTQAGSGMAIAGIILGIVGIILSLLLFAFYGYLFTTPEFQEGFREGYEGSSQ